MEPGSVPRERKIRKSQADIDLKIRKGKAKER